MITIEGDKQVRDIFRKLPQRLTANIYRRSARYAARTVLVPGVKNKIPDSGDFEHLSRIKKGVKTYTSKSKENPGVYVTIDKKKEVPVGSGKHRRFWRLRDYSVLVFQGNYNSPGRKTKSKGQRGNVEGVGNPFPEAAEQYGREAREVMIQNLLPQIQKEISKMSFKGGR